MTIAPWLAASIGAVGVAIIIDAVFPRLRESLGLPPHREFMAPVPDMPLKDVAARIVGEPIDPDKTSPRAILDALHTIRDGVLTRKLTTWGKKGTFMGFGGVEPRLEIPLSHWQKYRLDYLNFQFTLVDKLGPNDNSDETYEEIEFSRAQIDKVWPASRRWPLGWLRKP